MENLYSRLYHARQLYSGDGERRCQQRVDEVSLPLAGFKGLDTSMITMLSFNAGPVPGHYVFDLADVRLVKE